MNTASLPLRVGPKLRMKGQPILIVGALCVISAFVLGLLASELVSAEMITVIGVTCIFFCLLGWSVARARVLAERPKWFIFIVWALLLASDEIFSYVNDASSTYQSQFVSGAYAQGMIWLLAAAGLLLFLLGNPESLRGIFSGRRKWLAFYVVVVVLSVWYEFLSSVTLSAVLSILHAPEAAFALAWAFKLGLTVLILQACSKQLFDLDDISAFLLASIAAYVFLVAAPSIRSLMPDPTGAYGQNEFETRLREGPTGLSEAAGTFALLALTVYSVNKKRWMMFLSITGLMVMIVAGGKAAIVAGIVSGLAFFGLQRKLGATFGFILGIGAIFVLALMFTPLSAYISAYTHSGQVFSLTGRTELWAFVMPAIKQNFFLGHGYVASRFVSVKMPGTPFQAGHMHNGFLEALYNNGLLGLVLILMVHVAIVRNLVRTIRGDVPARAFQLAVGCSAIYTNLLINGMFNATFGGRAIPPFMLLLALFFISDRLSKEVRKPVWAERTASAWAQQIP